jgi:hypothetical protein
MIKDNVAFKFTISDHILRFRRGNFACRKLVPRVKRGPCGSWLMSWRWGQLGWELKRWAN